MAQKTIAQLRELDAERMARRLAADPTEADLEKARHTLRIFYRFAAYYERSFYIDQERTATEAEKAAADEKSERAYIRTKKALAAYNLKVSCPGLYPIIEEASGAHFTLGHYYH